MNSDHLLSSTELSLVLYQSRDFKISLSPLLRFIIRIEGNCVSQPDGKNKSEYKSKQVGCQYSLALSLSLSEKLSALQSVLRFFSPLLAKLLVWLFEVTRCNKVSLKMWKHVSCNKGPIDHVFSCVKLSHAEKKRRILIFKVKRHIYHMGILILYV